MTTSTKHPAAPATPATPVITRSEAIWRGQQAFDAGPAGRTHRIDAGGKDAPGPVETLLNAIATCSALDVIDILGKRKTPIERLKVNIEAERRAAFPRRVERLMLDFHVDGAGIEREHAERAIQLSYERYCSVATSLAAEIITETRLTLNGEQYPAVRQTVWTPPATS